MPAVSFLHFQKYLLSKYCDFATRVSKASTGTQSIRIHDVYSFNTELAMHYRAIFQYGFFSAADRERLCCHVLVHISRDKIKTGQEKLLFPV